jgi:phosphoribosyl 1,2-cyclic phosphodiesterase
MNYNIIATGSDGNAVVINGYMLIDCGVSFKALVAVKKQLKIVLLTHIHSDHFNPATIRRLAVERPTLRFACCDWLLPVLIDCGVQKKNIDLLKVGKIYNYGAFKLSPIKLYHDAPNCGWRIFIGAEKAVYITDTSTVQGITAKDYDLYLIEANYSEPEIQERIKAKEVLGQYIYEYRVLRTHLSKEECDNWLLENIGENSEYVYIHQHKEDNNV